MESTASRAGVDLTREASHPVLAFVLALLSVPGSTMAWDLFDPGGFVIGLPLAIAAIVLGVQARNRGTEKPGLALAAILIGAAMIAMMVVWTVVESV
jgi:hypothetical protein